MAANEIDELHEYVRWMIEHPLTDSPAHAEFRRAMNRLRALSGQPPRVDEALELEREVSNALLLIPDVAVTLPPLEPRRGRPDFVVTRNTRAVVVKALASPSVSRRQARRLGRELGEALPRYGASRALVAVPDQVYVSAADSQPEPNVELLSLSRLPFVVDRALGGPA